MKDGDCRGCQYSGNCYQEKCYSQMKSVCNDFTKTEIKNVYRT